MKVIDRRAFFNCKRLKKVVIDNGCHHLGRNAFKNCVSLKDIYLPKSIGYIDDTTFMNCPNLILHCPKDSYAEKYAQNNNLRYTNN